MKFSLNSLNQFIDIKDLGPEPSKLAHKLSSAGFEVESWEQKHSKHTDLNDTIFEIDILPHRPDCLSHLGLSRELACILERKLKAEPTEQASFKVGTQSKFPLEVQVHQKALCPRYTGRAVYGIQVSPSPPWLKAYLQNLGLKSINNIVDITNYCLMQWGQPLHAFDLDRLNGKITVDFSQKVEKFLTLDDQEIILTGQELCIRDEKEPIALAGVIGGRLSGIQAGTKNIFLESACFAPSQVRQSSKRFHIETDSSYRFSRGVCSASTLDILRKATFLIQKYGGGEIAPKEYDLRGPVLGPKPITINTSYVERRLGMPAPPSKFKNWMKRLACQVTPALEGHFVAPSSSTPETGNQKTVPSSHELKPQTIIVTPPVFRFDLKIKEDLVEEYARLESYDKIPAVPLYASAFPKADHPDQGLLKQAGLIMVHEGFYQAINHSFISRKFSDTFLDPKGVYDGADRDQKPSKSFLKKGPLFLKNKEQNLLPVFIQNPLSQEYNMMRISLIPSLFKNAQQNLYSGVDRGRLFEIGKVFFHDRTKSTSAIRGVPPKGLDKSPYREDIHLGLIAWGQKEDLWEKPENRLCIYELKTAISVLLEKWNIVDYEWKIETNPKCASHINQHGTSDDSSSMGNKAPAFIHPYQYMVLKVQGNIQAYIGSLHPKWAEHYKIRQQVALGEMDMGFLQCESTKDFPLCGNTKAIPFRYKQLSPFPMVKRDLTFLLPKDFPAEEITKAIKKISGSICSTVKVLDVYEGGKLKEGERAVSFRLHLQSETKTLTEAILATLQTKLIKEITSHYPARLR